MNNEIEKTITISLRDTKTVPRSRRTPSAIKEIKENVARNMKSEQKQVWIDKSLNEKVWERGIQKPPKKITVKAVKFDDGLVEVSIAETDKLEKNK